MTSDLSDYEKDTLAQETHCAVAKQLVEKMAARGWKVRKQYVAHRGSVYLQFEQPADDGLISGKVRIADHRENSSSHVSAEVEILVGEKFGPNDLDEAAAAIAAGDQGEF